jgi:hypothetical protein
MPRKLPSAQQAWATLASLAQQDDGDQDVVTRDYVGPVPSKVIAAALLDLRARIDALEHKPSG